MTLMVIHERKAAVSVFLAIGINDLLVRQVTSPYQLGGMHWDFNIAFFLFR